MNCRLLVQFDTPADIAWYDIAPQFLNVVAPALADNSHSEPHDSPSKANPVPAAAAAPSAGSAPINPLQAIRKQNSSPNSPPTSARPTAISPLDTIRQQSKSATTQAESAQPAVNNRVPSHPSSAVAGSGAKTPAVSPLQAIRAQAARTRPDVSPATTEDNTKLTAAHDSAASNAASASDRPHNEAAMAEQAETTKAATSPSDNDSATSVTAEPASLLRPVLSDSASTMSGTSQIEQIRQQAATDAVIPAATDSRFDQVCQQAMIDVAQQSPEDIYPVLPQDDPKVPTATAQDLDASGIEDPVKLTFRGKRLPKQDDLKIIEGIGPKIEELFRADGIETWEALSEADPDRLKQILENAGPRFRMHNPETWPAQAKLAFTGNWQQLEDYQNLLNGGRNP